MAELIVSEIFTESDLSVSSDLLPISLMPMSEKSIPNSDGVGVLPSERIDPSIADSIGQRVPNVTGIEVCCGSIKGVFYPKKFKSSKSKCIEYGGSLITPTDFEKRGGRGRACKWKKSISLLDGSSLESYLNNEVDKAGVMRGKREGLRGAKGKSGLSMSLNKGLDESEIRSSGLVPEEREGSSHSPVCHDYGQSSVRRPTADMYKSRNVRSVPPNEADVVSVRVADSEVNDDIDAVSVRKDFVDNVATNDLEVDDIENESSGAEVNDVSETVDDVGHGVCYEGVQGSSETYTVGPL